MPGHSPARKARVRARNQARAAENARVCAALRAQGNCCAVCEHKGYRLAAAMVCELDSDFEGYVQVKPDHVCHRFENQ
jgi:hypothetical protein